jgi:hypothetical protein
VLVRSRVVAREAEIVALVFQEVSVLGRVRPMARGATFGHGLVDDTLSCQGVVVTLQADLSRRFPAQETRLKPRVGIVANQTAFLQRRVQLPLSLSGIVVALEAELRWGDGQELAVLATVGYRLVAVGAFFGGWMDANAPPRARDLVTPRQRELASARRKCSLAAVWGSWHREHPESRAPCRFADSAAGSS